MGRGALPMMVDPPLILSTDYSKDTLHLIAFRYSFKLLSSWNKGTHPLAGFFFLLMRLPEEYGGVSRIRWL